MRSTSFSGVLALVLVVTAVIVDPSAAFSQQQQQQQRRQQRQQQQQQKQAKLPSSRRTFFGKSSEFTKYAAAILVGSGIILQRPEPAIAAMKTGAANPFTGDYDDPNHAGCLRQVKVVGAPLGGNGIRSSIPVIEITGWDGPDGSAKACTTRPNSPDDLWQVQGRITSTSTATIDFSSRGGPDNLLATYEGGRIVFPDGNKWKKISEQKDRRPRNMSTLSSGPAFRDPDD